jgi:hypothetical protein
LSVTVTFPSRTAARQSSLRWPKTSATRRSTDPEGGGRFSSSEEPSKTFRLVKISKFSDLKSFNSAYKFSEDLARIYKNYSRLMKVNSKITN